MNVLKGVDQGLGESFFVWRTQELFDYGPEILLLKNWSHPLTVYARHHFFGLI
jgi:hypothetical protein